MRPATSHPPVCYVLQSNHLQCAKYNMAQLLKSSSYTVGLCLIAQLTIDAYLDLIPIHRRALVNNCTMPCSGQEWLVLVQCPMSISLWSPARKFDCSLRRLRLAMRIHLKIRNCLNIKNAISLDVITIERTEIRIVLIGIAISDAAIKYRTARIVGICVACARCAHAMHNFHFIIWIIDVTFAACEISIEVLDEYVILGVCVRIRLDFVDSWIAVGSNVVLINIAMALFAIFQPQRHFEYALLEARAIACDLNVWRQRMRSTRFMVEF